MIEDCIEMIIDLEERKATWKVEDFTATVDYGHVLKSKNLDLNSGFMAVIVKNDVTVTILSGGQLRKRWCFTKQGMAVFHKQLEQDGVLDRPLFAHET